MQIILHIGQSKTGTSAVQDFLMQNRSYLSKVGVLYPNVTVGGITLDLLNHNAVADSLTGESRFPNLTAGQYFEQFFDQAKRIKAKTMILSGEHFFGGQPRIWDVDDEKQYFDLYPNKAKVLSEYLKGYNVTLLAYLRPQVDWLSTSISHTIRIEPLVGLETPIYKNDQQFFELVKPLLQYKKIIDIWVKYLHPKEVKIVPYERKTLYKGSAITDFLSQAGLDSLEFPHGSKSVQVNQSLSREYIEIKKVLNHTRRTKNEERVIITCLERLSALSKYSSKYQLSDQLTQEVIDYVSSENDRLNNQYMENGNNLRAAAIHQNSNDSVLCEKSIAAAIAAFEKEVSRPRTRLLCLDYAVRNLLRKHAKPIHSILHQLKQNYRLRFYQK